MMAAFAGYDHPGDGMGDIDRGEGTVTALQPPPARIAATGKNIRHTARMCYALARARSVGGDTIVVTGGRIMGLKAALSATLTVASFLLVGGCSLSRDGLESHEDAESQLFPESYEQIYQRLSLMGEKCYPRGHDQGNAGNRLAGSVESEGELHKERGSADFRLVVSSWSVRTNYFLTARIEKAGSGSRVTTKVNNPLIAGGLSKIIFRWASGDQSC